MSVADELRPYFTHGKVVPKDSLISIVAAEEGFDYGSSMEDRDNLIRKRWNSDYAAKLLGKRLDDIIEDEPYEWSTDDEPHQVSIGVMLYANDIDWETGVLEGEYDSAIISSNEALFWERDELFVSSFPKADYITNLQGLSFERDKIELLRPSQGESALSHSLFKSIAVSRIGRPQKWDWEGAMAMMAASAQHPDGLPTGHGSQAKIETMMANWFVTETGDAPSSSQIRQHVSILIRKMARPGT